MIMGNTSGSKIRVHHTSVTRDYTQSTVTLVSCFGGRPTPDTRRGKWTTRQYLSSIVTSVLTSILVLVPV